MVIIIIVLSQYLIYLLVVRHTHTHTHTHYNIVQGGSSQDTHSEYMDGLSQLQVPGKLTL